MPSLWEKLFSKAPEPEKFHLPDDSHLDRELRRVDTANAVAAHAVEKVVARQIEDTRIIRSVIDTIIERQGDRLKPRTGDRR